MIFFETSGQALIFLMLLYAGAGAAVTYDVIAPLRRRAPRPIAAVLDVFWCLMAGILCALALAAGGENKMRAYALLGLFCGGGIYALGIRSLAAALFRLFSSRRTQR